MPRPRSFDEDTLLDAAVELFWVKGFTSASLSELSAATGVTNGSLYQAYGNKRALFLAAYRRYCASRVAIVEGVFTEQRADIEQTVIAYFDAIVDDCLSHPDRRGCLMLNTISEMGTDVDIAAISAKTIDAMEIAVARALASVAPDAVAQAVLAVSAAQVVALSQAMIQLSRIGRDTAALRQIGGHAAASTSRALQTA